jgi:thiamine biosynthesis protein ThiS
MIIQLNGEEISLEQPITVQSLLDAYNIDKRKIAVEKNGEIVFRRQFEETILQNNDKIEIIHFIGGG